MIYTSPTDRAEAALLGRILLDEEARAHGHTGRPRLLEQARRWGITSAGLFGRGYHADLWSRIQEVAARGEHATRPSLHDALVQEASQVPGPDEPPAPHPETAAVTHLITTADTSEANLTSTERCAGMVMDGAMHRSVHEMAVDLARATRGEPGEVARTASGHKQKLHRMRQVWERLPGAARADLQALATPPPAPLARASLGTEPTTGPEDLIICAVTALDQVGIDPPELEHVLGEAYVPETEQNRESEQGANVPTARVNDEELTVAEETELQACRERERKAA